MRRTTGTKPDTLPWTARSWTSPADMRAHPAGELGEGATAAVIFLVKPPRFQSTPPARGATRPQLRILGVSQHISIHAPREGGDVGTINGLPLRRVFQSTPPAKGATASYATLTTDYGFQSTPPARGGDGSGHLPRQTPTISIHAPREGGDVDVVEHLRFLMGISIHAPHEGGDAARRSTRGHSLYFNPRPPRGGRHQI